MAAFRPDYRRGEPFGVRDARGRLVLDRRGAADLNAILAELRRLDKMSVAPPLTFGSDAAGRHFGLTRPPSRFVQLSGSASPYAWTDAIRTEGGGSEVVDGGQTGTAYEANGLPGLGGHFLTIDRTAAGDWRCQAVGVRGGGPYTITFAAACRGGVGAGVGVTIADPDGATVYSGTTGAFGRVSGLSLTPGTIYTYTLAGYGSPRWADSGTFGTPIGTTVELVNLPAAAGYVCVPGCTNPVSNRLTLDLPDSPYLPDSGSVLLVADVAADGTPASYPGGDGTPYTGGDGDAVYTLAYLGFGGRLYTLLRDGSTWAGAADLISCAPFAMTLTHTFGGAFGSVTYSITEAPPVP